jgi:hypothetical protein
MRLANEKFQVLVETSKEMEPVLKRREEEGRGGRPFGTTVSMSLVEETKTENIVHFSVQGDSPALVMISADELEKLKDHEDKKELAAAIEQFGIGTPIGGSPSHFLFSPAPVLSSPHKEPLVRLMLALKGASFEKDAHQNEPKLSPHPFASVGQFQSSGWNSIEHGQATFGHSRAGLEKGFVTSLALPKDVHVTIHNASDGVTNGLSGQDAVDSLAQGTEQLIEAALKSWRPDVRDDISIATIEVGLRTTNPPTQHTL